MEATKMAVCQIFRILKEVYGESEQEFTQLWDKWKEAYKRSAESTQWDNEVDRLVLGKKKEKVGTLQPLSCIFNALKRDALADGKIYSAMTENSFQYPTNQEGQPHNYTDRKTEFLEKAKGIPCTNDGVLALYELCRRQFYYYPSGYPYLSVFERIHLSCCFACCMEQPLVPEQPFLLVSCGFSGIQDFIYTVSGKDSLKILRSRSFYVDVLVEHLMDELLEQFSLFRANLLYNGGGNGYLLLPNSPDAEEKISNLFSDVNNWLLEQLGGSLYANYSCVPCSAEQLVDKEKWQNVFKELSEQSIQKKYQRYTGEQLEKLNQQQNKDNRRECRICHTSSTLNQDGVCENCQEFQEISSELMSSDNLIVITNHQEDPCQSTDHEKNKFLRLPAADGKTKFLYMLSDKHSLFTRQGKNVRVYHPNPKKPVDVGQIPIYLGNYFYQEKEKDPMPTFEKLAGLSQGISRIGVLRADVDSLGKTFEKIGDDVVQDGSCRLRWTNELSRQLTLFFKHHVNCILRGEFGELTKENGEPYLPFSLSKTPENGNRKLVVVYSGGDDMFLAGAWDQIIEAAVDLYQCLKRYTDGTLTFSAGIGIFPFKYPLQAMASETGLLENAAKQLGNKNGVALFGMDTRQAGNPEDETATKFQLYCQATYHWEEFINIVIMEKLRAIQNYFSKMEPSEQGSGNSFLFNLYEHISRLEQNLDEPIQIARAAYLLARMSPQKSGKNDAAKQKAYQEFSANMLNWIKNSADRKQLLTAMRLFIYLNREKTKEE